MVPSRIAREGRTIGCAATGYLFIFATLSLVRTEFAFWSSSRRSESLSNTPHPTSSHFCFLWVDVWSNGKTEKELPGRSCVKDAREMPQNRNEAIRSEWVLPLTREDDTPVIGYGSLRDIVVSLLSVAAATTINRFL